MPDGGRRCFALKAGYYVYTIYTVIIGLIAGRSMLQGIYQTFHAFHGKSWRHFTLKVRELQEQLLADRTHISGLQVRFVSQLSCHRTSRPESLKASGVFQCFSLTLQRNIEKLSDADPLEVFGGNLTGSCGAAPWKDSPSSSPDDCQGPSLALRWGRYLRILPWHYHDITMTLPWYWPYLSIFY